MRNRYSPKVLQSPCRLNIPHINEESRNVNVPVNRRVYVRRGTEGRHDRGQRENGRRATMMTIGFTAWLGRGWPWIRRHDPERHGWAYKTGFGMLSLSFADTKALLTFPPSIRSMLFTAKSLLPKWIIHHKPQGESRATCSYLHGQLGPTRACTMRGGETW